MGKSAIAELDQDALVTFDELADRLGERRDKLARFVASGVIVPIEDGRFLLKRSVVDYWSYWRAVIVGDVDGEKP